MTARRRRSAWMGLALVSGLVWSSCSASSSVPTSWVSPPSKTSVALVSWTNLHGQLSGVVRLTRAGSARFLPERTESPFTGVESGSSITITFTNNKAVWQGSITRTSLVLEIPNAVNVSAQVTFRPGDERAYEGLIAALPGPTNP